VPLAETLRRVLFAILCLPLFAACSATLPATVVTRIERVTVDPPPALWIVDLTFAGRSCSEHLDAVRRFVRASAFPLSLG
jgi:hypothetical protein